MKSHKFICFLFVILASAVSFAQDQQPPNRTGRTITNRDSYTNRNPTIQPRPGQVVPMSPALTPVVTKDPQTGELTTHVVVEEDYPSAYRTITTRDPRTGRTIAQRVPVEHVEDTQTMINRRVEQYRQKLQIADEQWQSVSLLLFDIIQMQLALDTHQSSERPALQQIPQMPQEPNSLATPQSEPMQITDEIAYAYESLIQALRLPETTDDMLAEKLNAYTQTRTDLQQRIQSAQSQLGTALTTRQQAILTTEGVL